MNKEKIDQDIDVEMDTCKCCDQKLHFLTNSAGEKLYQRHACAQKPQHIGTMLSTRWGIV